MPTATDTLHVFHLPRIFEAPGQPRDSKGRWAGHGGGMSGEQFDRAAAGAASGRAADDLARVHLTERSQRSAIDSYAGSGHDHANTALRSNGGDAGAIPPSHTRDIIDGMDSIMADHPLSGDIVVVRGVASGRRTFGGRPPGVGTEWTDHGYVSTTTDRHPEKTFTGESGIEMRILVRKGTRAFSNNHLDPGEVVLDRGLTFRVVADHGIDAYRGTRQLDVEIVGQRNG